MSKRGAYTNDPRLQMHACEEFVCVAVKATVDAQGLDWRERARMNLKGLAERISLAVFDDPKACRAVKKLLGGNIRTWKDLRNALNERYTASRTTTWLATILGNLKKPSHLLSTAMKNERDGRGLGALPLSERNELKRELIAFKKTGGW